MAIEIIKNQILKFLATPTPEVIAIKGAWGVGKTYSWNKYLTEAKTEKRIGLSKYSYVSLFGINSLEALKFALFENVVSDELIGVEANLMTFAKHATGWGKKALGVFRDAPWMKNFTGAINSLSFLSLSDTLICIDDLERKGNSLTTKDVLGLISQLKEHKKCKVAILFNEAEEGQGEYAKYREKVVDIELEFAPTSSECASIAFEGKGFEYEAMTGLTKKLDINNIRVLKKMERLVNLTLPFADGCEHEVKYQIIRSLVFYSWCYFGNNKDAPTLEFVEKYADEAWALGIDKNLSEDHKRWFNILIEYGYRFTDDLDRLLLETVRCGCFEENLLTAEVKKKNGQIIATKSVGTFNDAWRPYQESFDNNQPEVISTLYENFRRNVQYLEPAHLNAVVLFFRELEENKKATELINYFISQRKDEVGLFNISDNYNLHGKRDKEMVAKFQEIYSSSAIRETPKQILERITTDSGYNVKDDAILASTSVDEYYHLFKSEKGPHLHLYIEACLKYRKYSNASEEQKQMAYNATEALLKIANESEINANRVRMYGVEVTSK